MFQQQHDVAQPSTTVKRSEDRLGELEEVTKHVMDKGKRGVKKAARKVNSVGKQVFGGTMATTTTTTTINTTTTATAASTAQNDDKYDDDVDEGNVAENHEDGNNDCSSNPGIATDTNEGGRVDGKLSPSSHPTENNDIGTKTADNAKELEARLRKQRDQQQQGQKQQQRQQHFIRKEFPKSQQRQQQRKRGQQLPAKSNLTYASSPTPTAVENVTASTTRNTIITGINNNNNNNNTERLLIIYASILTAYHAWTTHQSSSSLLSNTPIPFSLVVVLSFLSGYGIAHYEQELLLLRNNNNNNNPTNNFPTGGIVGSALGDILLTFLRRVVSMCGSSSGIVPNAGDGRVVQLVQHAPTETTTTTTSSIAVTTLENREQQPRGIIITDDENDGLRQRTKKLARRGKSRLKRFGRKYVTGPIEDHLANNNNNDGGEWEEKLAAPFSQEGPLMDHLLKYSDFTKHGRRRRKSAIAAGATTKTTATDDDGAKNVARDDDDDDDRRRGDDIDDNDNASKRKPSSSDISMGNANLKNTKAESLESDEQFMDKVLDVMCELRGMDLFLTDDPEEEIWREPLLIQSGLRDVPTFIANMMFPFGNMTAYFKLPDWFDDWDNIPEEKEDDPPNVKALKRFLLGDEDYRNARCKVIPHVVDGPLAIRLIKPRPMEVNIDGPRHPATWHQVSKKKIAEDPLTNETTSAAVLECDIDVGMSNKQIRKIINVIRPHIESVTIDVALIVGTPNFSEVEEPSACIGLWRIEKVDFESAAVFPELAVEDAAEKVKMIMSGMEMEEVVGGVAAA